METAFSPVSPASASCSTLDRRVLNSRPSDLHHATSRLNTFLGQDIGGHQRLCLSLQHRHPEGIRRCSHGSFGRDWLCHRVCVEECRAEEHLGSNCSRCRHSGGFQATWYIVPVGPVEGFVRPWDCNSVHGSQRLPGRRRLGPPIRYDEYLVVAGR